jgi:hypothetical protein
MGRPDHAHRLDGLMPHESIETTLRYYVGRDAQATANTLWAAHRKAVGGNIPGNTRQSTPEAAADKPDVSLYLH